MKTEVGVEATAAVTRVHSDHPTALSGEEGEAWEIKLGGMAERAGRAGVRSASLPSVVV